MNSPRVPLSPKHSNSASSSPSKSKVGSPFVNHVRLLHRLSFQLSPSESRASPRSPTRSISPTRSPTRSSRRITHSGDSGSGFSAGRSAGFAGSAGRSGSGGPGFVIFEDPKTYRGAKPDLEVSGSENRPGTGGFSTEFVDQENALQPKAVAIPQRKLHNRKPLAPLSTNEFSGHITFDGGNGEKLTQLWHPPNCNNGHRSVHKKLALPSFVTPPRKQATTKLRQPYADPNDGLVSKYLYKSNMHDVDPELDMEMRLISKNNRIRKRRLMSVGRNEARAPLVCRPQFKIAS